MKKIARNQTKSNKRISRRVVMVKSIRGHLINANREEPNFRAQLVNVSGTGAQFYSHKTIYDRAEISLELNSLDGGHTIVYSGKIIWVRKSPMKTMGRFAYGVRFDELTPEQVDFLKTNYSMDSSFEEDEEKKK
jgi:c-di-GMP-binding flagellar brake protein YcgR